MSPAENDPSENLVNTSPAKTPHQIFSIARVTAIASNTLLELVRLKVFYFLLIFALLIIASGFSSVLDLPFQDQFQMLKDVSLGAMSIFTILLATLATANMLPKDIEDRTLYTILAKPVPRFEYLLGKLLGMFLLLLVAMVLMSLLFLAALYSKYLVVEHATRLQYAGQPETLKYNLDDMRKHAFPPSLAPSIVMIYIMGVLLATMTMLISTFSSSYIFTLFISFTCYFIGNIEGTARDYLLGPLAGAGTKIFLQVVTLVFPDLRLFNLVDDAVAGNVLPPGLFEKTAALGLSYVVVYGLVAYVIFASKEL